MDEKSVKRNLRLTRKALGLSQQEMAEQLGISRTAYRSFEMGATRVVSEYVSRMAELAGKTEEEVLYGAAGRDAAGSVHEGPDWENRLRTIRLEYEARLDEQRLQIDHLNELLESKNQTIRLQEQLLGMYARKSEEND